MRLSAASSRCHRSTFFTGFLSAVRQPLRFQLLIQRHDAVAQILAVGVQIDPARPLQRFERGDRRHQLHAVVGGVRLAAFELLLVIAEGQDRAPAARAGIARAGAVGVDDDVRQLRSFTARSLRNRARS